jgi:hypothetical protein
VGARLTTAVVITLVVLFIVGLSLLIHWRGYRAMMAELAPESEQPDPAAYHELVRWRYRPVRYLAAVLALTVTGIWVCYAARVNVGYGLVPFGLFLLYLRVVAFGRRVVGWARRVRPASSAGPEVSSEGTGVDAELGAAVVPRGRPSPVGPEEHRNTRAFIVLFIVVSGVSLISGAGTALGAGHPRDAGAVVVGILYGLGGVGGVLGLLATLRGNRRWSRLAYLMAIGFPVGTLLAVYIHVLRVEYLGHLDEGQRGTGRPTTRRGAAAN